jgi:hypothetical protein
MQLSDRTLPLTNSTLQTLTIELAQECQTVLALVHQLQLPNLTPSQQATILAELLTSTIHLHTHCDEDLQILIADTLEALPDTDEA